MLFLIPDQHGGLVEAAARHFQGASGQRCQILGHCGPRVRDEVAAAARLVLQAADMPEARRRLQAFAEHFEKRAPKAVECLKAGFEDAMAVMSLPEKYRKRLRNL